MRKHFIIFTKSWLLVTSTVSVLGLEIKKLPKQKHVVSSQVVYICDEMHIVKFTVVWHIIWFLAGTDLKLHKHIYTHIHIHMSHSGTNKLSHPHKHIVIPHVMCLQQLSVLHWINNLLGSKINFPQYFFFFFFFGIIHL